MSNRLTFSLASLIVLIAFGLIVGTPSAVAHDLVPGEDGDQHVAGTNLSNHPAAHPILDSITLGGAGADGVVNTSTTFLVTIVFSGADPSSVTDPFAAADITNTGSNASISSRTNFAGPTKSGTAPNEKWTYTVVLQLTGEGLGAIEVTASDVTDLYIAPAPTGTPTPPDPRRPAITADSTDPSIPTAGNTGAPRDAPLPGKDKPLSGEWAESFYIVFNIAEANGISSIDFTADPDELTFGTPGLTGSGNDTSTVKEYRVKATPKGVSADETSATNVLVSITAMDKAGNSGSGSLTVALAPRTVGGGPTGPTTNSPPVFASTDTVPDIEAIVGRKMNAPLTADGSDTDRAIVSRGDTVKEGLLLPVASDNDNDDLSYTLTEDKTSPVPIFNSPGVSPGSGPADSTDLVFTATDFERKQTLHGTPTASYNGKIVYEVSDGNQASDTTLSSRQRKFNLKIKDPIKPGKIKILSARSHYYSTASPTGHTDGDTVTLTWKHLPAREPYNSAHDKPSEDSAYDTKSTLGATPPRGTPLMDDYHPIAPGDDDHLGAHDYGSITDWDYLHSNDGGADVYEYLVEITNSNGVVVRTETVPHKSSTTGIQTYTTKVLGDVYPNRILGVYEFTVTAKSKLEIPDAERSQSGAYADSNGANTWTGIESDVAYAKVADPSEPTGKPLATSNATAGTVTLTWTLPVDSRVLGIDVSKTQKNDPAPPGPTSSNISTFDTTTDPVAFSKEDTWSNGAPITDYIITQIKIDPATGAPVESKDHLLQVGNIRNPRSPEYLVAASHLDVGTYQFRVTAFSDAGKSFGSASDWVVKTAGPPTPAQPPTAATSVPDKGYLVFVRDIDNAPVFGTANPAVAQWAAMPNLYEFFTHAPGGSLQLNVTNVAARKVVISEMMWAVDEGKVGQNSYDGQQWIEVYNNSGAAIAVNSISFTAKKDRPALLEGTDLISNVVGAGSLWIRTKGQNGNSGAADGSGQKEFVSMYRNNYGKEGWNGGHWTTSSQIYHPNHKGTPGAGEVKNPTTFPASGVALGTVFNEIANHASANHNHEWIELRKKSGELNNLENWVVDMVTGVNNQKRLFKIPKLNDGRYGDILLITKTDPARDDNHPLRGGYDVTKDIAAQKDEGRDENIRYYVAKDWTTNLPDNGEFVLILRHGADKTNHEKVEDLAGYHPNLKVDSATFFTNLWPLRGYAAPNIALNKIDAGKVHRRQKDGIPGTKTVDKADNADHVALRDVGWTGIGYKRNANAGAQNGGTPGYPNGALAANNTAAGGDPVIISEIMYATGDRGTSPQWIELRNTSQTAGINLDGWQLTIVNHDQDSADSADTYSGDLVKDYNLNGKIPPGQTFLIVAHSGTNNTNLPSERIQAIRARRGELILSQYGFEITLKTAVKDGNRAEIDMVGNLVDSSEAARIRNSPQSYETPEWMLPSGMTEDGSRISIVRVRNKDGSYEGGMDGGKLQSAWQIFDMSVQSHAPESTYYGNRNDLSNPGYTYGGVLPVSLSKFRPERLATGEIVVRWVTESETNNAGFNILRGEALDGEFTKLNKQLIKGQGTTSERTGYAFVDKTAKPNVVYYYQIQDVSLDGDVVTLRTTHLRGNISVVGKLTTTWGELKALQ